MKKILTFLALAGGLAVLAACTTPESRIAKQPELFSRLTPQDQQMIREGRIGLGYTMDMVRLALGDPDRVHERIDASGKSEIWSYLEYEDGNGVILYSGWWHRGWGGAVYPYYLDAPGRRVRAQMRVVFREGRVVSFEQEKS